MMGFRAKETRPLEVMEIAHPAYGTHPHRRS
jgi:hypothetical protein